MSIEGEVEKENLMNTPSSFQDLAVPTGVGPFVCIPAPRDSYPLFDQLNPNYDRS